MTSTVDDFMPNSFNEGKLNPATELREENLLAESLLISN